MVKGLQHGVAWCGTAGQALDTRCVLSSLRHLPSREDTTLSFAHTGMSKSSTIIVSPTRCTVKLASLSGLSTGQDGVRIEWARSPERAGQQLLDGARLGNDIKVCTYPCQV